LSHENLDVWKTSTELSINLYTSLKTLKDFGFKDQITRAGPSVPSNIAEGMARNSDKEKVHFLAIANGSCAELRTQIYIGIEIGYIDRESGKAWMANRYIFSQKQRPDY
jgi:four helix bundle protein